MYKKGDESKIKPVSENELPPEFKKFDRPFGMEQHTWNLLNVIVAHVFAVYYLFYLFLFGHVPRWSALLAIVIGYTAGLGVTIGGHRYWTHKTFKAKKPLQYILMIMQTMAFQYPIFKWCRDHRVHHKYTDTDADPHSAARGFWFSHIGWLFKPKHPKVEESLKIIDISDLARDPVVRFQSKYYWQLCALVVFAIPIGIGHLLFPEMTLVQLIAMNFTRYSASLHFTFFVNSLAHYWGDKPYDKYISATENKYLSIITVGEGFHNYHHVFPWDYKAAELGFKYNLSTLFIHFFATIGWIYDMKTVSHKLLVDRLNRTGNGTHPLQTKGRNINQHKQGINNGPSASTCFWGWGDGQLRKEDLEITETIFPANCPQG